MARNLRKWVIKAASTLPEDEVERLWVSEHKNADYKNVWSPTEEPQFIKTVLSKLSANTRKVLVPGCGSRAILEAALSKRRNISAVVCTDFLGVVEVARRNLNTPTRKIKYLGINSERMGFNSSFDAVIAINSYVSGSDVANRKAIHESARALKRGGVFIGLFPCLDCFIEVGRLSAQHREKMERLVCQANSSIFEGTPWGRQIIYSPLHLRRILIEVGLELTGVEIQFFGSKRAIRRARKVFGFGGGDLMVYELLVTAQKR